MPHKTSLTYSDAGVDIDAGNRLVEDIKVLVRKTSRPGVLSEPGGFAALFEVPLDRYRRPVLVSGTDGVGTKLKLALEARNAALRACGVSSIIGTCVRYRSVTTTPSASRVTGKSKSTLNTSMRL